MDLQIGILVKVEWQGDKCIYWKLCQGWFRIDNKLFCGKFFKRIAPDLRGPFGYNFPFNTTLDTNKEVGPS